MGYIFEELIRKFSESYDEQAGAHFTSRDIIYLMTELLIAPERSVYWQRAAPRPRMIWLWALRRCWAA